MTVRDIKTILNADVLCCEEELEREVHSACGSDLMSDVLAFVKEQAVLLTGLINPQAVRTAEMMDMSCIVFVRGKQPTQDVIDLAQSRGIILLSTKLEMFSSCGLLFKNGLQGGRLKQ
ncbi:MAG TPA: DRTGG domain-containing protein [Clostridiales bacterium]|jgi:predicted transcriptional regulator|nr:DRTGG domain-containing protein [Clostridiales bacterium]HRT82190.1 DRTGG domain-containing protein [Oscillospiraceae bacterium]